MERHRRRAEHQVPVLTSGTPALRNTLRGQVEHPAQGIIAGKAGLAFRNLPELAVEVLNHIRRVYDLAIFKNDETTADTRYFLSSATDVERFAQNRSGPLQER